MRRKAEEGYEGYSPGNKILFGSVFMGIQTRAKGPSGGVGDEYGGAVYPSKTRVYILCDVN